MHVAVWKRCDRAPDIKRESAVSQSLTVLGVRKCCHGLGIQSNQVFSMAGAHLQGLAYRDVEACLQPKDFLARRGSCLMVQIPVPIIMTTIMMVLFNGTNNSYIVVVVKLSIL